MQLELDGIGQQLATLEGWKEENKIFTRDTHENKDLPWIAWDEIESPYEFSYKYSFMDMAFGSTEKEAIENYCQQESIRLPFWW